MIKYSLAAASFLVCVYIYTMYMYIYGYTRIHPVTFEELLFIYPAFLVSLCQCGFNIHSYIIHILHNTQLPYYNLVFNIFEFECFG